MITGSIDHRLRFQQVFWFSVILLAALVCGYFLATNFWMLAFGTMGFMWLILLPYHSKVSIWLAIATFSSALIVPLFPGRPYLWEFAALLGWSGLVITISMRQSSPDYWKVMTSHRMLFIGAVGYCLVLIATMLYRGIGLRILGSEVMGGRFYFQQLTCAIFPFVFVLCPPSEKMLVRLFSLQCLLTVTFMVSDFVLSRAPEALFVLLQFFELSSDAINFEMRAERFGIRRYQSFYVVGSGFFLLLLLKNELKAFFSGKALYLIPTAVMLLALGAMSGHRYLTLLVVGVLSYLVFAQRFFTPKNVAVAVAVTVLGLVFVYLAAERLPVSAQRAISFLPGVQIDSQAKMDAMGTLDVRRQLRKIGFQMVPQHLWIGRGFSLANIDYSWQWDPTTVTGHVNQGRFYNGFVGLLVNTGLFGTLFMLSFLGAGLRICWGILKMLRRLGAGDDFLRLCGVVSGLWVTNTIAFLFFHGDSEYAMKTFSLQAGMLLICNKHLQKRMEEQETTEESAVPSSSEA